MSRAPTCRIVLILLLSVLPPASALAAQPAAELLPATTRGYLSIPNLDDLLAAWNETQLGHLVDDPAMRPFLDELLPRFRDQLSETNVRFGLTWQDLRPVAAGEVSLAALEPTGRDTQAVALLVDIGDRNQAAQQLLQTVRSRMVQRRAAASVETHAGLKVTVYKFVAAGSRKTHSAYLVIHQNQLLATDHPAVLQAVAQRWQGRKVETLASRRAFQLTQSRTQLDNGAVAHVRWFVEPFGMARILRAANGGRGKRGTDTLQVLESQGFAALDGVGGQVALHTGEHEILHRTFVAAGSPRQLAARMLDFPNGAALEAPAWVPANVGTYVALRWNMPAAFEHSKSLVNALAGERFFDEFLANLENDPNGPQVNLRRDLIQHLGRNITFISDCQQPITPQSERFLCAVEITNTDAVRKTVNQALQSDPSARRHVVDGHVIWEIVQEQPAEEEMLVTVEISGAGFDFGTPAEEEIEEESVTTLPRSSITVVDGRLIVASSVEYIVEILRPSASPSLTTASDYGRVSLALEKLGAGQESFRVFSRSDEAYRATYELLRQNRADESESLLGRLLKRFAASNDAKRPIAEFDGSRLPEFAAIEQYLGPAGVFVESETDGWAITGCLLPKAK